MQRKPGSVKRQQVASDLQEEREKIAFDQQELRTMFCGSQEAHDALKKVYDDFRADPETRNFIGFNELTPHEMQEDMWRRNNAVFFKYSHLFRNNGKTVYPYTDWFGYFQGLPPGFGLHFSMFSMAVTNLASPEQREIWVPKVNNCDILGCYAQTEIGHGSNVAGLETTATLDKTTDEFVIHTPSITATKYWPGDMGRFASHALVFARLIIDEDDYGVQPFLVPLRDTETWKVLPGVKCGDLGPKIGYTSKDNGWASFDKVRIPRSFMLMGLCSVSKEGEVSLSGDPRVLYSVMMIIRMLIVRDTGYHFSFGATKLAIRYCSVRRQFSSQAGTDEERKILDYQTSQHVFAKLLGRATTETLAGVNVVDRFRLMLDSVYEGDFSRMEVTHHLLSGFKALFSDAAMVNIDEARRACGGAGYQSNAGFTQLFSAASPMPTYEGDNTVMLGQASRYLIKLVKKSMDGKKLVAPFTYIGEMQATLQMRNQAATVEDFLDIEKLDRALQARACSVIASVMKDFLKSDAPSKVRDNELFQQRKVNMTKYHFKYLQFHLFRLQYQTYPLKDARIPKLLELVGKVFALNELIADGVPAFDAGYLAAGSLGNIQEALEICVRELRPQMVPLAETPMIPDDKVPSVIGNEFGDIYEMQLETAMGSRLNVNNEVPSYFDRLMKPILRAKL